MAEMTQSQLMAQLKKKGKGAWQRARKVEPKARGQGGFPPNLKGLVCKASSYALKATQKGDPFFQLQGVVVEPDEYKDRKATFMWFMNETDWATVEDNMAAMANDLQLLGKEMPEEEEGIPDVLKDLVDEECHIIFNTGGPRKNGNSPNLFIQGKADQYDGTGSSDNGDSGADAESDMADDQEGDGGDNAGGTEAEATEYSFEKGEVYGYMYRAKPKTKAKKINIELTAIDTKKEVVAGIQVNVDDNKPTKGGVKVKGVPFSELIEAD